MHCLQTLTKYVRHVPELDDRLKLAKEYECNQVIVDCLVGQKDRQQLIEFVSTLTQHTNDYYYGQGALNNAVRFWLAMGSFLCVAIACI